ncbi:MAG: hypothetical protein KUL81_14425 [Azonexus sp.]|nr:hypothetical protein [Azonexus sp.]
MEKLATKKPPAFSFLPLALLALLLNACASSQARFETLRDSVPLRQDVAQVQGYRLLLLERQALAERGADVRVYIEGDGRPWLAGGELIAADPTPRKPLALALMAQDEGGALYLGRPCYFLGAGEAPCHPRDWTSHRYSEQVVAVMSDALSKWLASHPRVSRVSLVGYSGGGVLAMLIGERVPQVRQVIAVAAPLDHAQWTKLHAYSALSGSLNVARQSDWRPGVERWAVFGEQDNNVPYAAMRHALPPGARVLLLPGVSHECCGDQTWTSILGRLNQAAAASP